MSETVPIQLTRQSAFSYQCNRCRSCCFGKKIPLTPYDLVRLSEELNQSTSEVIQKFTEVGVFLKSDAVTEACVFLGEGGCSVHGGRPAACRVYPLGRIWDGESENFVMVEPHPKSLGVYGSAGTVDDFLQDQQVDDYFSAGDEYLKLYQEIVQLFEAEANVTIDESTLCDDFVDVDRTNREYCLRHDLEIPSTSTDRVSTHLQAVREAIQIIRD